MNAMMNDLFDIRILDDLTGIPFSLDKTGTIYIVGNRDALSDKILGIKNSVLVGMDKSNTFYQYNLRVIEQPTGQTNIWGWNIICPIEDPARGTKLFVAAFSDKDDLAMAVSAVINEAESQMRKFLEEALIMAAVRDPEGYKNAVNKVIVDSNDDGGGVGSGHGSAFGAPVGAVFSIPIGMALGMDMDMDSDDEDFSADGDESCHEAAIDMPKKSTGQKGFRKVSAKDRKEAFSRLPEKISDAYLKENPIDAQIVNETLSVYSAEEFLAVLNAMGKKYKNLIRNAYDTTLQGVTKYKLMLYPWDVKYSKDFKNKNKYHYFLYVQDSRGKETPVIFKHNPSFCIYVMYMIDRYNRKEDVTDLSIRTMENEFSTIYKIIMDETDEKIAELFKGMSYRTTKSGNVRDGRYGEYIKDIHTTFEKLMDNVNSLPFKVGQGRYLQVPPEKMVLPNNLAKLKIV